MDTKSFKDRSTLRTYFLKNKIPTEANFADLINSTLNQIDDGVFKPAGDPLSIIAAGDAASPQKLLNFYGGLSDANPSWTLQMRPRSNQNDPATAKTGFSVSDGQGNSRLFIDGAAGNVGIGTTSPAGRLDVANLVRFGFDENGSGSRSISFARDAGDEGNAGKITYKGGFSSALNIIGSGAVGESRKIKLWDNVEVAGNLTINGQINKLDVLENFTATVRCADFRIGTNQRHNGNPWTGRALVDATDTLHLNVGPDWPNVQISGKVKLADNVEVSGALTPSAGNSQNNGIMFPKDPGGGSGDAAWIRYYPRSGENCTLEIGVSNDGDDHIALMPAGNVGIGTTSPGSKLSVAGAIAGSEIWSAGVRRFDLAEVTPVNEDDRLEQGDVVVIDASFGLRVTRSRKPGDTAVYGVVSSYEQAAMVIGGIGGPEATRNDKGRLPVALVGRVAVKVSAENGPIAAGDLLTTAATPGHAMRCDDRAKYAGAIVGKALEPLADGVGVIQMLVAMQ